MHLRLTRTPLTASLSGALLSSFLGCGDANKDAGPKGPTEQEVAAKREACEFKVGQLPAETIPAGYPIGDQIPLKHIVLIMQENRSYDHYFSELNLPGSDVASRDASNPDSHGNPVKRFHFTTKCMPGGAHGWDPQHRNWNGGKNDGKAQQ